MYLGLSRRSFALDVHILVVQLSSISHHEANKLKNVTQLEQARRLPGPVTVAENRTSLTKSRILQVAVDDNQGLMRHINTSDSSD